MRKGLSIDNLESSSDPLVFSTHLVPILRSYVVFVSSWFQDIASFFDFVQEAHNVSIVEACPVAKLASR